MAKIQFGVKLDIFKYARGSPSSHVTDRSCHQLLRPGSDRQPDHIAGARRPKCDTCSAFLSSRLSSTGSNDVPELRWRASARCSATAIRPLRGNNKRRRSRRAARPPPPLVAILQSSAHCDEEPLPAPW